MTSTKTTIFRYTAFLAFAAIVCAQEPQPAERGGWRRVGDPDPNQAAQAAPPPQYDPQNDQRNAPPPDQRYDPQYDQRNAPPADQRYDPQYDQRNNPPYDPRNSAQYDPQAGGQPNYGPPPNGGQPGYAQRSYGPPPADITIRPGTYVTVRIDQPLSSDRNHEGDGFTATLTRPLVVDGIVVAQAGQMLGGRVTEAQKAGRVQGVSRLGVELIDLGLVDGQQVPLKTSFVSSTAGTSIGRDAGAIGVTTGMGAAIGAAANGGVGAGIGAAAGAGAGLIGVLLTRGRATVLYPEEMLTFRVETPVLINTTRAPQAFHYVQPQEYQRAANSQPRFAQRPIVRPSYYPPVWGGPVWGGYPYGYYGPGYWGPSFSFFYGGGYYGRGYHRGYRR